MAWVTTKARNVRAGNTILGNDDWHIRVEKVKRCQSLVILDGINGFGEQVSLRRKNETPVTIIGDAK